MVKKSKKILTEISAGELLDKISILEIKLDKIKDKESLIEINREYKSLRKARNSNLDLTKDLQNLIVRLKKINMKLFKIKYFEKLT